MSSVLRTAEYNPFRVSQMESLKWEPVPLSINEIFNRWQELDFRGQLTGNHGSGKSTLALKLKDIAEVNGIECLYLFANEKSLRKDFGHWERKLQNTGKETIVIFDGIEHAFSWRRRKWLHRQKKCLILVHTQIKSLPLVCHLHPKETLLSKLCFELAGEEGMSLLADAGGAERLLHKHNSNLRECFFDLYRAWGKF